MEKFLIFTHYPKWYSEKAIEKPDIRIKELTDLVRDYAKRTDRKYSDVIQMLIREGEKRNYD